jgi:uncharacterized protein (DUF305 family)
MKGNWHGLLVPLILVCSIASPARQGLPTSKNDQTEGTAGLEMEQAIEKMHTEMASIKPTGDNDADFVRLMLPHHQAAIDMAKTELAHGKDPQMRRLAQEIVADQRSEIELMQLWLERRASSSQK